MRKIAFLACLCMGLALISPVRAAETPAVPPATPPETPAQPLVCETRSPLGKVRPVSVCETQARLDEDEEFAKRDLQRIFENGFQVDSMVGGPGR